MVMRKSFQKAPKKCTQDNVDIIDLICCQVNYFYMNKTFITLVAPTDGDLTDAVVTRVAGVIKAQGVPDIATHWLSKGRALDFVLPVARSDLTDMLRQKFNEFGRFDVFVQTDHIPRQKKLFFADMDATMIEGETLDDIAAEVGAKDKIAPITEAAMRGEIDFAESLRQRLQILKGTKIDIFQKVLSAVKPSAGAAEALRILKRHGTHCVLVSGGFDLFTSAVAATLGFHEHFGNRVIFEQGRLTGDVLSPILDKEAKKQKLMTICRARHIDPHLTLAVGDGSNDIPMLQTAGTGVGYFAKPKVVPITPHHIRYSDLLSLAYIQGYVI